MAERIRAALSGLDAGLRRTVTFDRGFEFMGYPALDRSLDCTSHLCDPRNPWQKGAVENANGRPRRYPSSDVPAERLPAGSLAALAARLNGDPAAVPGLPHASGGVQWSPRNGTRQSRPDCRHVALGMQTAVEATASSTHP